MSFLIILEFLFFNFKHTLFTLFISSTVTLHGFIFLLKDYHRSFTVKCKNCLDEIMLIMQNNSADSPRRVDAICGINQQMAYATIGKKWLAYS